MAEGATHDPTLPPSPLGGWSAGLTPVANAVIVPTLSQDMIQPMGVFDAEGNYRHEAVLWRGRPLMVEPELVPVQDDLPGRWIWGGVLLNHFGHFLTESTGRLWAVDAVQGAVDGLIFVSKRDADESNSPVALQNFHRLFFDLLGITLPVRIVTRPTRVALLEVPGQGFGIGPMASGTAAFRSFMAARFAREVAPAGSERLYISRSGLSAVRGGILEEARLEQLLAASGYEIYHPQRHSLTEQVARYKAARQIVALDGSALHLLAMAGRPDQQVAMIKRRASPVSDGIVAHLAAFMQRPPLVVDVILQDWIRSDRRRADRFSVGELDFAALGAKLAEAGFIEDASGWATLTPEEARAAIGGLEQQLKRGNLTFQPSPRREGRRNRPARPAAEPGDAPRAPRAKPDADAPTAANPRRERRMAMWAEQASTRKQRRQKAEEAPEA